MAAAERKRLGQLGGALMIIGSAAAVPACAVPGAGARALEFLIASRASPWARSSWSCDGSGSPTAPSTLSRSSPPCTSRSGSASLSDDFGFYQVLIGVYTAYVVKTKDLPLADGALHRRHLAPLFFVDETFSEQAHHILVILPVLFISAAVVRYLRGALAKREREYRHFALEAVGLAERIRGAPAPHQAATVGRRRGAAGRAGVPDARALRPLKPSAE